MYYIAGDDLLFCVRSYLLNVGKDTNKPEENQKAILSAVSEAEGIGVLDNLEKRMRAAITHCQILTAKCNDQIHGVLSDFCFNRIAIDFLND